MSIANLFQGLSEGFNTFASLKQAQAEENYRRQRLGLEDQDRTDRLNLEQQREAREQAAQQFTQKREGQLTALQAIKDAGFVGATPDMLDANRNSNQAQAGTGAGFGGPNLMQSALRSLTLAQQAPGYDPHKAVDVGSGLSYRGPAYEKPEGESFIPLVGPDNSVTPFNRKTGAMGTPTGFIERARTAGAGSPAAAERERLARVDRYVSTSGGDSSKALAAYFSDQGQSPMAGTPEEAQRLSSLANDFVAAAHKYQMRSAMHDVSGKWVANRIAQLSRSQPDPNDPYHVKYLPGLPTAEATKQAESEWAAAHGQGAAPSAAPAVAVPDISGLSQHDAWDKLTASGMDPDKATEYVKAKLSQ